MSKAAPMRATNEIKEEERAEWLAAVERLVAEAESWCARRGWWSERELKTVTDDDDCLGAYLVPMLRIQTPKSRFVFEPIARYVVGAQGRIDLAVFPSYHSAAIVRRGDGWQIVDDANQTEQWSEEAFIETAARLAGKA